VDPVLMAAVYTLVVGLILQRGGKFHQPYPAFVMCGVIFWKSFSNSVNQAITSISKSEGLIKSYSFPKAALPISLVLTNQIVFAFALIPVVLMALFYQFVMKEEAVRVGPALAFVPVLMAGQLALTLGVSLMFSCFGVFFRDLSNIMGHVLRVVWYVSAGMYSISDIVGKYNGLFSANWSKPRSLFLLNPFAHIMEAYRDVLIYGRAPDPGGMALVFCVGLLSVFIGLKIFRSQERKFAKYV
jgi:ABC-type polysaccharide/polyol phosphate export permease